MAKRSYIQSIKTKQSSAYRADRTSTQAIHRIDGSSKREASRSNRYKPLKSWTINQRGLSEPELDAQAEKQIKQLIFGSWSKQLNPICPICYTMKSISGECC